MRVSNEPCADRMTDGQRELALNWTDGRLDAYGERRDIEQERSGCEMAAWRYGELAKPADCKSVTLVVNIAGSRSSFHYGRR